MKLTRFLCLIILLSLSSKVSAQFPGSSEIDNILFAASKTTVRSDLMIIKEGDVIYNRSFGENVRGSVHKVGIASASKWVVAATLLTLVDKGQIELDDSIGKYLPQFKGQKSTITLRQLLSHTSGLPANSSYILDKKLSLAKSVENIALYENLIADPGTQFTYGQVSYQVAARLAEMITGKDWESLVNEKIAIPCKMINTDFGNAPHKQIGIGAFSSIDDFGNFQVMILNKGLFQGSRVLSANSVYEMIRDQTATLPLGSTPYRYVYAKQSKFYGLGVWLDRVMPNDSSATEISCHGKNTFAPWINFCKHLAGVYSFDVEGIDIKNSIEETKTIINNVYKDNCHDMFIDRMKKNVNPHFTAEFINQAKINFKLDSEADVKLKLYDSLGNEIVVLMNGKMKAGEYLVQVDSLKLSSGMYFYNLEVNDKSETKKFTIKN